MGNKGLIIGVVTVLITKTVADGFGVSFVEFELQLFFTMLGVLFIAGATGHGLDELWKIITGEKKKQEIQKTEVKNE